MSLSIKKIVEAMLFVADTPLDAAQLAQIMDESDKSALQRALEELAHDYEQMDRAFGLVQVAGGYMFRTRPELAFWLKRLRKTQTTRLSRAALETLAIVAYKQPVLKAEIERIRGVEIGSILKTLMEKNLVRVAGRRDLPGRPLIYATTKRFLEVFDLKDIKDLPTLEEMAALTGEPGRGVEGLQTELQFPDEDAPTPGEVEAGYLEELLRPAPSTLYQSPEADDPGEYQEDQDLAQDNEEPEAG